MQKAIEIAKKISDDFSQNYTSFLSEHNAFRLFKDIENIDCSRIDKNRIICFVIYAYHPDSLWLDLKKDRAYNKIKILKSLGADASNGLYAEIINLSNDNVNSCVFEFLEDLKTWEWAMICNLLDWASRMQRFAIEETEEEKVFEKMNKEGQKQTLKSDVDIKTVTEVNERKGVLLDQAIKKRRQADELIEEIKKKFVTTDSATKDDFNFIFTETAKKADILSWRHHIKSIRQKSMD